ncbi:zinc-finger domain-containing protein [Paenibacillus albus]|nr:zinc-finger domain-containing protein [Paenibacillus albus]
MTRAEAVNQIGLILDKECAVCPTRDALNQQHKTVFSRIDGYCNRQCSTGQRLQELGRSLSCRQRNMVPDCE